MLAGLDLYCTGPTFPPVTPSARPSTRCADRGRCEVIPALSGSGLGKKDDRPGLEACLKSLREGDTLIVWKLDRLGRDLRHLVNTIHDLMERKIGFRVLSGQGANIDTTTAGGRLVFGIFAALAEFERELIRERTIAGLSSARARGRNGGRPYTMTPAKLRLRKRPVAKRDTKVGDLCKELGVTRQTLYRFVDPKGELRPTAQSCSSARARASAYEVRALRAGYDDPIAAQVIQMAAGDTNVGSSPTRPSADLDRLRPTRRILKKRDIA